MKDLLSGIVRRPGGIAAAAALALAASLQLAAIHRQSLTYDEPYHLLAGYQTLRFGENLVNYEHPPLVKMAAALPLLAGPVAGGDGEPLVALTPVESAYPAAQFVFVLGTEDSLEYEAREKIPGVAVQVSRSGSERRGSIQDECERLEWREPTLCCCRGSHRLDEFRVLRAQPSVRVRAGSTELAR